MTTEANLEAILDGSITDAVDPDRVRELIEEARTRTIKQFSKKELRLELQERLLIEEVTSTTETVHSMLVVVEHIGTRPPTVFNVLGIFTNPERLREFVKLDVGFLDDKSQHEFTNTTFTSGKKPFTFRSYRDTMIYIFVRGINQPIDRSLNK